MNNCINIPVNSRELNSKTKKTVIFDDFDEWWSKHNYSDGCKGNCLEAYKAGRSSLEAENKVFAQNLEDAEICYESLKLNYEEKIGIQDCECSTCAYTDSPCTRSDYDKNDDGICVHYKNIFERCNELEKAVKDLTVDKKILARENKYLGERVLELQKDKGSLTDEVNELKEKFAQTVENDEVAYETLRLHDEEEIALLNSEIKELKEQINRLKTCDSCKKNIYDDEKELFVCSDKTCKHLDKWECKE